MFNNKVGNQYTNALISGSVALGVVLTAGTTPAQAANFTQRSSLGWSNGTSDFVEAATAVFRGGPNPTNTDIFQVTFSPDDLAFISGVSGDFTPFFTPPVEGVSPAMLSLGLLENGIYNTNPPVSGIDIAAQFETKNDLVFNFDNGTTLTLPTGSTFLGELGLDGSVELELEVGEWSAVLPNGISGTAFSSAFTFDESEAQLFGQYSGGGTFEGHGVPEPGTVVGLLAVGGLGLLTKRKKQA